MYKNTFIFAEVKTLSPFGWKSAETWDSLFEIANKVGDALSIHTDPRWGGSFDLLQRARRLTTKPILAKGIHATDREVELAVEAGADYVLVVGRTPQCHLERCLIEPVTIEDLAALDPSVRAVWNSRDLSTGGMKKESFADARKVFPGWLCQASNIRTVEDIALNAEAVLVGSNLRLFAESLRR
jgi:indole-3-glycerol phosphate synthase